MSVLFLFLHNLDVILPIIYPIYKNIAILFLVTFSMQYFDDK